ncbi:hypothetical protein DEJ43_28175 [Streptomyces venezuelae ATCC 10712]|nr:hypothetical protein vnz_27725 [Streptomyces venezuelae]QES03886.1 hypothetical protein DEJ43_28175 [Streptomyces venezuelae ATCC 10712]
MAARLDHLNEYLTRPGTPPDTVAVLADVFDPEHGALGAFTTLAATASRFAQQQATQGLLPPEVWLALGRAANELNDIGLDLDEHLDTLAAARTPSTTPVKPPVPVPLVVRRHR